MISMNEKKEMCSYCGKWFPVEEMKKIFFDDLRNSYCLKCYPGVLEDVKKLPWNKKAPN